MEELKLCPFCGAKPEIEKDAYVLVYCNYCYEETGRTVDTIADSLIEATKEWNTRV